MATKLKDMKLTSVDLVRAGANQEADICLFKSATEQEATPEATESPTEPEKNIFKRFIAWLKENPTEAENEPQSPIEKADEQPDLETIYKAAIIESIQSIVGDDALTADEKIETIEKSLEQFYKKRKLLWDIDDPENEWDPDLDDTGEGAPPEEEKKPEPQYEEIEEVHKYNHHHGADGRFSSGGGGGGAAAPAGGTSFGARPASGGWTKGTVDGYKYSAKVYSDTSGFGISGGSVSKLEMRDASGKVVARYDRGSWEGKPAGKVKEAADKVAAHYDKGLQRYEPGESWDTSYNPNSPLNKSASTEEIEEVQKDSRPAEFADLDDAKMAAQEEAQNGGTMEIYHVGDLYIVADAEESKAQRTAGRKPMLTVSHMEHADMQWAKKSAGTGTH